MSGEADTKAPVTATNGSGWETEETLKAVADAIRSKVKVRHGVVREVRVEYFKGESQWFHCACLPECWFVSDGSFAFGLGLKLSAGPSRLRVFDALV
jgi:hypothetical protein